MQHSLLLATGLLLSASTPFASAADPNPLVEPLKSYRFGGDAALISRIERAVNEARPDATRRAELARALASLLESNASFDAKQFVCRQLILIAEEEQVPALSTLLMDEALGHYALMVLTRIPGERVNEALRTALSQAPVRVQLAILDSLGERGDSKALPQFTRALNNPDVGVAAAAASGLGKLGTIDAAQALRNALSQAPAERKLDLAHGLLICADRLLPAHAALAAEAYEQLDQDGHAPPIRAAALQGLARARGVATLPRLLEALTQENSLRQIAAATALRSIPDAAVTTRLCERLPQLPATGQLLGIAALSDRADAAAEPALNALTRAGDKTVRIAALRALGRLHQPTSVPRLLELGVTGDPEEVDAARSSLAMLRGEAIDARLLSIVDAQPAQFHAEAIRALGQRRVTAAVPRLMRLVQSGPEDSRAAATRVLSELAGPRELNALLDLCLATKPGERDNLLTAVEEVARRAETDELKTAAILERYSKSSRTADRVDLLNLAGELGGTQALGALRQAAASSEPEIRLVAVRKLAEWSADDPLPDLWQAVSNNPDSQVRTLALRGFIRLVGLSENRPDSEAVKLYRDALQACRTTDEKRLVLAGLARVKSVSALELAADFLKDGNLRGEAELAVVEIGRATAGAAQARTRELLSPIAQESANPATRTRAQEVLASIALLGEFVTAWEASPAYTKEGAGCAQLFDIPFPPEIAGREHEVSWRIVPLSTVPNQPWLVDLLALWGGDQRVAYLRTAVWSETARDLTLELGSDDGVKVWWNDKLIHAANVQRAVAPAQEKVKVAVKAGWNPLMIKVTQNVMGWGICARFANPDGAPVTGLRYELPSSRK